MKKFPHIKQFRNVVQRVQLRHDYVETIGDAVVYDHNEPYPIIEFTGTVKIHGANCNVVNNRGKLVCYSRGNLIDKKNDHHGFVEFIEGLSNKVKDVVFKIDHHWVGEWCGKSIQKGCAIHKLSKRFIIFDHSRNIGSGYKTDNNIQFSNTLSTEELQIANSNNIFFIDQFKQFRIKIDFNKIPDALKQIETMVTEVENQCPIGKYFGVDGNGEGIVWRALLNPTNSEFWFKTKGVKHKNTKSKRLVEIDPVKVANIDEFIEFSITEQRLQQGLGQ